MSASTKLKLLQSVALLIIAVGLFYLFGPGSEYRQLRYQWALEDMFKGILD